MSNGDPLYYLSRAIDGLSSEMRELRTEMGSLRGDLQETRETVAKIQGQREGEAHVEVKVQQTNEDRHRAREFVMSAVSTVAIALGAYAAFIH